VTVVATEPPSTIEHGLTETRTDVHRAAHRLARRSALSLALLLPGCLLGAGMYAGASIYLGLGEYHENPWPLSLGLELSAVVAVSPILTALAYTARYWRMVHREMAPPVAGNASTRTPRLSRIGSLSLCASCVLGFLVVLLVAFVVGFPEIVLALPEILLQLPAVLGAWLSP
jgi:hypothetical protein